MVEGKGGVGAASMGEDSVVRVNTHPYHVPILAATHPPRFPYDPLERTREDEREAVYFALTLILFGLASSAFGMVILSIPLSNVASALSPTTALGRATTRLKAP